MKKAVTAVPKTEASERHVSLDFSAATTSDLGFTCGDDGTVKCTAPHLYVEDEWRVVSLAGTLLEGRWETALSMHMARSTASRDHSHKRLVIVFERPQLPMADAGLCHG